MLSAALQQVCVIIRMLYILWSFTVFVIYENHESFITKHLVFYVSKGLSPKATEIFTHIVNKLTLKLSIVTAAEFVISASMICNYIKM